MSIINKLKQKRKKKGFTLVELVVVILIIAILAAATFLGGATVIKQARNTKAVNDLRNYSSYMEDMFYNHPGYASDGITSGKVVESLNEYLTSDLAVKAGVDESKGTSVELKDAWDNAYNYAYYRNQSATEAAVLVWSNGPDQVSESSLTSIEPTIVGDDIAVLIKMVDGEVSTQMISGPDVHDEDNSGDTGGTGGGEEDDEEGAGDAQQASYVAGFYETGHIGDAYYKQLTWEQLKEMGLTKENIESDYTEENVNVNSQNAVNMGGELVLPGCEATLGASSPDDIITKIGAYAFYNCGMLSSITTPDGVTSIGNHAFYGCWSLAAITIPNSIITIGESAFETCYELESITFNGTKAQWNAITKGANWNTDVPNTCIVHCTNGDMPI